MYAPRPRDGLRVARSSGSDALTQPAAGPRTGGADHRWAVTGRARAAAADHPWEEVLAITPVAVRCRFHAGAVYVRRRTPGRRPGARRDLRAPGHPHRQRRPARQRPPAARLLRAAHACGAGPYVGPRAAWAARSRLRRRHAVRPAPPWVR